MTKERLEEIRKQKGTVYTVFDGDKEATALVLDEKCNDNNILAQAYFCLSNLFETKERAEWVLKTTAERTERFEPPMWEDIENTYQFKFVVKYGKVQEFYTFDIRKDLKDDWAITIDNGGIIFESEPTKENYIKACEIVRDLFNKGGVK